MRDKSMKPRRRPGLKSSPARQRKPRPSPQRRREQPLGVGVGDPFAVRRVGMPTRLLRARPQRGVLEIGWATFGELARKLAHRIAKRFHPDAVVGLAKGGIFVGSAVSAALGADFHPVRVEKRARDPKGPARLVARQDFPKLAGKRVLVVDDVANTGKTLENARALAKKSGAKEVRAAVLVVRPGGAHPDWFALETDELIVFGWDYQLQVAGSTDPGEVGV